MNGLDRLRARRWSFAGCLFDEANWTLVVDGRRVAIEAKPLQLLRELLLANGQLVTKDELLDRIWPDVHVVEASLTTAVHKLRHALGDDGSERRLIETAPGLGYRLVVSATVEEVETRFSPRESVQSLSTIMTTTSVPNISSKLAPALGALFIGLVSLAALTLGQRESPAARVLPAYSQLNVESALRHLDVSAVEKMIAAGWDPAKPWDKEGNDALSILLNRCEWEPGHDRRQLLLMARTLIEAGAPIDRRNVWGDTAYSISKAPRYCGPDHPVTQMLEAMCYGGEAAPKDLCLATYELTAEQRKAQGLPLRS